MYPSFSSDDVLVLACVLDTGEAVLHQVGTVSVILKTFLVQVGDVNGLMNNQTQYDT